MAIESCVSLELNILVQWVCLCPVSSISNMGTGCSYDVKFYTKSSYLQQLSVLDLRRQMHVLLTH